jgi:hypothetical protein|tara:strand:+ start:332 stop:601 length:270 start_codon:yes stop_codon:yes gene_type:complete
MTFTITPNSTVASLAQHVIDTCSRQKAAQLLADMYNKQIEYMMGSLAIGDDSETVRFAENIGNLIIIAKAYNIHRDMHVERLKKMPYKG